MTIIALDIPAKVLEWYTNEADEMRKAGLDITINQLLVDGLHLNAAQASRPGGPGAFLRRIRALFRRKW